VLPTGLGLFIRLFLLTHAGIKTNNLSNYVLNFNVWLTQFSHISSSLYSLHADLIIGNKYYIDRLVK